MRDEQQEDLKVRKRKITPTDLSQYLRLGQCERYLRLRLHERSEGRNFFAKNRVSPQEILPLLTLSGREFERRTEDAIRASGVPFLDFAEGKREHGGTRSPDNARVLESARALPAGGVLIGSQPRLEARLDGWDVLGDVDLLRMERADDGTLRVLLADVKSSNASKVDHRLQVAFYAVMLDRLFREQGIEAAFETAVLYRGSEVEPPPARTPEEEAERAEEARQRADARRLFGVTDGLLERVPDPDAYRMAVRDLVTGPDSTAERVASAPFGDVFFALGSKCDGCLYNEFCLKDCFEHDDLSLIPYLEAPDKRALLSAGVRSVVDVARLKEFRADESAEDRTKHLSDLAATPETAPLVRRLGGTSVGARLDEIIYRSRSTQKVKRLGLTSRGDIPGKGHSSLPRVTPEKHPNLVSVYIDAGYDYLQDRIYMLGARVTAHEGGEPARTRTLVRLSDGPPDSPGKEAGLFAAFLQDLLAAVVESAAPDANGEPKAPIHLFFWDAAGQKRLLEGLSRNLDGMIAAAPAVYDFVTQIAAFDSPIASFLDDEVREQKNLPVLCPSLHAVASVMKFMWSEVEVEGESLREVFRERVFDYVGKAGEEYYTKRSRYGSDVPLEYAYVAWGELPGPEDGGEDPYAPYRKSTVGRLEGFQAARLEAMEWIAGQLKTNKEMEKTPFKLPDLAEFEGRARHLAQALDEFLTIERHVELAAWKAARLLPPERRALLGETLITRYVEEDQEEGVAEANRDHLRRNVLREQFRNEYKAAHPNAKSVRLPADQKAESDWDNAGMRFVLRLETDGVDGDLDAVLGLCGMREGDSVVLYPRLTQDSRLPEAERTDNTPTPKQMLYGSRAKIAEIRTEKDAAGRIASGAVVVEMSESRGGTSARGYTFSGISKPLNPGEVYTIDPDPNDFMGMWASKVTEGLCAIEDGRDPNRHPVYDRLAHPEIDVPVDWPEEAESAQRHFLVGLAMFHKLGLMDELEESKHRYIGAHGGDPLLLVQGPPGTGKSYSTAYAVLARVQGMMAAGREGRVLLSCKTHAATDVLQEAVLKALNRLRALREADPALWRQYFDARLLDVPLLRYRPKGPIPPGIMPVPKDDELAAGELRMADRIASHPYVIAAATPGGIYNMVKSRWGKPKDSLFGHGLVDLLVLDEASQMSLPEAMMAALPLSPDGRLIVVGDPRQMPPIVKHDWENEARRTFGEYRSYESLFLTLLAKRVPLVQFQESFRLHAAMAEFLRGEIYTHDGIEFFSRREPRLPDHANGDDFTAAVLSPGHPIVVIVHGEAGSQTLNAFEQGLITPVLRALADGEAYGFDAAEGLGVVVPHRAQRAALKGALPELTMLDPLTGEVRAEAVDTVERFQGAEREVILVSTTESDREYLRSAGEFLLNPCRLNVALSRAKTKMILVASESVFGYFSDDEELFANSQIWKNLLRRTCTEKLWEGERDGHRVTVWGNKVGEDTKDRFPAP